MTLIGTTIDSNYVIGKDPTITTATQADLAQAALQAQSASEDTARDTANTYVTDSKDNLATGVMIYNATGVPLTFRSNEDYSGHMGQYPFDTTINNGQWSVFAHLSALGAATGSIAVVGYNIEDGESEIPVAVIGWNNPYSGSNTALGDCWSSGGYTDTRWSTIQNILESSTATGSGDATGYKYGYSAPFGIGQGPTALLRVTVQKNS